MENFYQFLESFGYLVKRRHYLLAESNYPDTFLIYEENTTSDEMEYDNASHCIIFRFRVYIFSKNIKESINLAKQIKKQGLKKGYKTEGIGYGITTNDPEYVGRCLNISFIERME